MSAPYKPHIPADIWQAARKAVRIYEQEWRDHAMVDSIAEALLYERMAERERAAKIAENTGRAFLSEMVTAVCSGVYRNSPAGQVAHDNGIASSAAEQIAAAIRSPLQQQEKS